MATKQVPTSQTLPRYSQKTALEGRTYNMDFHWNTRDNAWYLSLAEEDGTPVVSGVKLVANWPLTRRVTLETNVPGMLIAFDTTGLGEDPSFEELGTRVQLLYKEEADLP